MRRIGADARGIRSRAVAGKGRRRTGPPPARAGPRESRTSLPSPRPTHQSHPRPGLGFYGPRPGPPRPARDGVAHSFGESGSSITSILRIQTWLPGSCCWKAKWPSVYVFFVVHEVVHLLAVDLDRDVVADRLDLLGEPGVGRDELLLDGTKL